MISVIRINILYLQTVQIKQPGPVSQYRIQVSNMFTVNFLFCPSRANAGRFKNISCDRNGPKLHKHMTNYRGVKLAEETCRLTAESKSLYGTVWLKLFFIRCFCGNKTFRPQRSYVRTSLRWFWPKKTLAGIEWNKQQSRTVQRERADNLFGLFTAQPCRT